MDGRSRPIPCQFQPARQCVTLTYGQMRLRASKDRLKVEHSIIGGLREVLEDLLHKNPSIRSIIPGRIRPVRDAKGPVKIRITTPTQTGWKGIALASGARQELFLNTCMTKEEIEKALGPTLKT